MNIIKEELAWGTLLKGPYYKKGLAQKLAELSYAQFNGESAEVDLFVEIIIDAARNRHEQMNNVFPYTGMDFLYSDRCVKICEEIQLNYEFVMICIEAIIDYFDHGIGKLDISALSATPEIEEEETDEL